ncbi:MAG: type 4a pilus biogenesis protein PilO [Gammaproteobacteria bacterium]|nr:type 4a pilus biogenesis protein PilO [Gammaproteobacteria bacterium]
MSGQLVQRVSQVAWVAKSALVLRARALLSRLDGALHRLPSPREIMALAQSVRRPRVDRLGGTGLALLTASAVLSFSTLLPLRHQVQGLRDEVTSLEAAAQSGNGRPASQAMQASALLSKLPTRSDLPAVLSGVLAQATAAGLKLERGTYEFTPAKSGQIARYRVTLPVSGTYGQVRRFVEGTLATLPAVALEGLRLEREGIASERLSANLQFAVMVRSE